MLSGDHERELELRRFMLFEMIGFCSAALESDQSDMFSDIKALLWERISSFDYKVTDNAVYLGKNEEEYNRFREVQSKLAKRFNDEIKATGHIDVNAMRASLWALAEGRYEDVMKSPTANVAAGAGKKPEELVSEPTKS